MLNLARIFAFFMLCATPETRLVADRISSALNYCQPTTFSVIAKWDLLAKSFSNSFPRQGSTDVGRPSEFYRWLVTLIAFEENLNLLA